MTSLKTPVVCTTRSKDGQVDPLCFYNTNDKEDSIKIRSPPNLATPARNNVLPERNRNPGLAPGRPFGRPKGCYLLSNSLPFVMTIHRCEHWSSKSLTQSMYQGQHVIAEWRSLMFPRGPHLRTGDVREERTFLFEQVQNQDLKMHPPRTHVVWHSTRPKIAGWCHSPIRHASFGLGACAVMYFRVVHRTMFASLRSSGVYNIRRTHSLIRKHP